MMHRVAAGFLLSGLVALTSAQAALPPYWQRTAEMSAILDDRQVAAALRNKPVERIEWSGAGLYRVSAEKCQVDVRTIAEPQSMPGPARYRVESSNTICR